MTYDTTSPVKKQWHTQCGYMLYPEDINFLLSRVQHYKTFMYLWVYYILWKLLIWDFIIYSFLFFVTTLMGLYSMQLRFPAYSSTFHHSISLFNPHLFVFYGFQVCMAQKIAYNGSLTNKKVIAHSRCHITFPWKSKINWIICSAESAFIIFTGVSPPCKLSTSLACKYTSHYRECVNIAVDIKWIIKCHEINIFSLSILQKKNT